MNIGESFLLSTPPNGRHLYIVITELSNGNILCVNATTKQSNSDTSCVLSKGDHPFIQRDSVIDYKRAREIPSTYSPARPNAIPWAKCSSVVVQKIQEGGLKSKRLKNKHKVELQNFMNKQPQDTDNFDKNTDIAAASKPS